MGQDIHRNADFSRPITITNTSGACTSIPFASYAGGMIEVPSGASAADLTFYGSKEEDGDYKVIYASDQTTPLTIAIVSDSMKELPPNLFAAHWLKIVSSVAQSEKMTLLLKS